MCGIVIAWPMFHPRVSRFNREFKQPEDNDKDRVTSYGYRYRRDKIAPCKSYDGRAYESWFVNTSRRKTKTLPRKHSFSVA